MLQNFNPGVFQDINVLAGTETGLRSYYVACAKHAQKAGLGRFIDGRLGNPSRYVPKGGSDPFAKGPAASETLELTVEQIMDLCGTDRDVTIETLKSGGRFIVGRKTAKSRYVWGAGVASADDSADDSGE